MILTINKKDVGVMSCCICDSNNNCWRMIPISFNNIEYYYLTNNKQSFLIDKKQITRKYEILYQPRYIDPEYLNYIKLLIDYTDCSKFGMTPLGKGLWIKR